LGIKKYNWELKNVMKLAFSDQWSQFIINDLQFQVIYISL